jgi:hypothetical protein
MTWREENSSNISRQPTLNQGSEHLLRFVDQQQLKKDVCRGLPRLFRNFTELPSGSETENTLAMIFSISWTGTRQGLAVKKRFAEVEELIPIVLGFQEMNDFIAEKERMKKCKKISDDAPLVSVCCGMGRSVPSAIRFSRPNAYK